MPGIEFSRDREIESLAIERVFDHIHKTMKQGCQVYPLAKISKVTALDPCPVQTVMEPLEEAGPYRGIGFGWDSIK